MNTMMTRNDLGDFLDDPENAQRLDSLVEDVRYALIDYRVRTPGMIILTASNICPRLHCNEISIARIVKRL